MATYDFTCDFCKQTITVDAALVGEDMPCPSCGATVTVPRQREKLALKGRAQPAGGRLTVERGSSDNLSSLANVKAFGDDRAVVRSRERLHSLLRQVLAGAIILALLGGGAAIGLRMQARKQDERQRREAVAAQRRAQEKQLADLRREVPEMNRAARARNPYWTMPDETCLDFWLTLNAELGNRAAARQEFDRWVETDAALCGLLAEQYALVIRGEDLELACLRLTGMAFGLHGDPVPSLHWIDWFRRVAQARLARGRLPATPHGAR